MLSGAKTDSGLNSYPVDMADQKASKYYPAEEEAQLKKVRD